MADPAPLDQQGYVAALLAGRTTYDLMEQAGRPHKLFTRSQSSRAPDWSPEAVRRPILASHACGTRGINSAKVEATPVGPPSAPVTPGGSMGGPHPVAARAGALNPGQTTVNRLRRNLALHATSPRSEPVPDTELVMPRCGACKRRIRKGQPYWGIHHVKWVYAEHEECEK